MDKVVKANLERARFDGANYYQVLQEVLGLHFSVVDKADLLNRWKQSRHECADDLWRDSILYLHSMGYRSKLLDETFNELEESAKKLARRYDQQFK